VICVVHAHPYPSRSRANAALLAAIREVPQVQVRSLYDLYPDFDIDTDAERKAVEGARLVAFLHPIYWYAAPALLKHWFDTVLVRGWAYGEGGTALRGKDCLWIPTTGGDDAAYSASGRHRLAFASFTPVMEQTARFCGMNWLEPFVVHGAHLIGDDELRDAARALAARLRAHAEAANA
jgi:glutathione-regulated potassium-efflux system ancillary protein KefF